VLRDHVTATQGRYPLRGNAAATWAGALHNLQVYIDSAQQQLLQEVQEQVQQQQQQQLALQQQLGLQPQPVQQQQ
jgi:hypothetical protein